MEEQDEEWLALAEAIEAWGDPELRAARRKALAASGGLEHMPFIGLLGRDGFETNPDWALANEAARARDTVVADFRRQLESGELVATGWPSPLRLDGQPQEIAARLWRLLELDVAKSAAKGPGLELIDVRVRPALPELTMQPQPPRPALAARAESPKPRRPGRPSIKHRLAEEMRRRAEGSELLDGIGAEARALRSWAEQNIQGEKIPQAKSIQRSMRALYRELTGAK